MPPVLPSTSNNALGARPAIRPQRTIHSYTPIVPESSGEGLAALGKEITKKAEAIGDELYKEKQDNDLKQAQIDYSTKKLSILEEYEQAKGQDALDGFGSVQERLAEARKETLGTLGGRAAEVFDLWSQNEALGATSRAKTHISREREVVNETNSKAFVIQMQNEIVSNPNDKKWTDGKRAEIIYETNRRASEKGIKDPTARAVLVRENLTAAHEAAITALLGSDQADAAEAYLKQYEKDISAKDLGRLQAKVLAVKSTVEGQRAADEAVTKFDNEADALEWVRKKYEGKKEEAAIKEVKERFSEKDKAKARKDRDALEQGQEGAKDLLAENPDADELTITEKAREKYSGRVLQNAESSIRSHFAAKARADSERDKALRASANTKARKNEPLTNEEQEAVDKVVGLNTRLDKVRQDAAAGRPQISDKTARDELYKLRREDPAKFAMVDLHGDKYGGKLNGSDLHRFENWQLGLDKSRAKESLKSRQVSDVMKMSKSLLIDAGFIVGGKKDNTGDFQVALADALDDIPDDKVLTEKEKQEIVLGLLLRGEMKNTGTIDDDDARAFEAGGGFYAKDFFDENKETYETFSKRAGINDINRTATILEGLARAGEPTTAAKVREVHEKLKAKGK